MTRRSFITTAGLVLALLFRAGAARADEIVVMTSGAFTAAYLELAPGFERATGHRLVTATTTMGTGAEAIPARLARGERADVVIVAADSLDEFTRDGRIVAGSRVDLARSSIAMAVRAGARKPDISSLDGLKQALLQASSVAYSASVSGDYLVRELFPRLGIAEQVTPKSRRIERERVGAVVARGEAELGFQQISELLPIEGIEIVGPLPPGAQRVTVFAAGIATQSANRDAARTLIAYLASPAALAVAQKSGLEPLAKSAAPATVEGDVVLRDFRFHTGEVLAELKLHYTTVGAPTGQPVLVLHGTAGSGGGFLNPAFAGELFGPGQPLDAATHYIILPDAIGSGRSAKPSDGLRAKFPHYNYADMVEAQYRLVTEALHVTHLRAVLGYSQGGMHTWLWGVTHPDFMDALVPMASQPTEMASRNWMLRRLMIETIRHDPEYQDGNYTRQPWSLRYVSAFFNTATNGGTLGYYALAPTHAQADALVDQRLAAPPPADANDFIYAWDASADYNPGPALAKIRAAVLAINSEDDERNPPETGATERALRGLKNARLYVIPASPDTRGHATANDARYWKGELASFLASVPRHTGAR